MMSFIASAGLLCGLSGVHLQTSPPGIGQTEGGVPAAWCRAVPKQGKVQASYANDRGSESMQGFDYATGDFYSITGAQVHARLPGGAGVYGETGQGVLTAAPWLRDGSELIVANAFPLVLIRFLCAHPERVSKSETLKGVTRVTFEAPVTTELTVEMQLESDESLSYFKITDAKENFVRGDLRVFRKDVNGGLISEEFDGFRVLTSGPSADDTLWTREGILATAGVVTQNKKLREAAILQGLERDPSTGGWKVSAQQPPRISKSDSRWPYIGAGVCLFAIGGFAWWRRRTG